VVEVLEPQDSVVAVSRSRQQGRIGGASMTKQFCSSVLTVLVAALFSMPMATAVAKQQCSASSGAHGYWSWRMIDDRKCWYEGKPKLSKSMLEWPSRLSRPAIKTIPDEEVASAAAEKPADPMDAQARVMEKDSRAGMIDTDSFDSLWRARIGH
jgi:hypothetical protein